MFTVQQYAAVLLACSDGAQNGYYLSVGDPIAAQGDVNTAHIIAGQPWLVAFLMQVDYGMDAALVQQSVGLNV